MNPRNWAPEEKAEMRTQGTLMALGAVGALLAAGGALKWGLGRRQEQSATKPSAEAP